MFGMEADRFTGRKILVAGALSALGPPLVHQLIGAGAAVLATDSRPAALAGLAAWLDGAVQIRATDPEGIARWIRSDHPDLAGVILADPRDGTANLALAGTLAPLLARRRDPFLGVVRLTTGRERFAAPVGVPQTIGILQAAPTPEDAARLAADFLKALRAGRDLVRLGRAGGVSRLLNRAVRGQTAPSGVC